MNGAQVIVKILQEQGVDTLFRYPGGMMHCMMQKISIRF